MMRRGEGEKGQFVLKSVISNFFPLNSIFQDARILEAKQTGFAERGPRPFKSTD